MRALGIPNSRLVQSTDGNVQLTGGIVQFVGYISLFGHDWPRLAKRIADGGCVGNFLTTTVSFSVELTSAARQDLAFNVADQLGYVVVEIKVMTRENPRGEL
jgi:hypothetical protein